MRIFILDGKLIIHGYDNEPSLDYQLYDSDGNEFTLDRFSGSGVIRNNSLRLELSINYCLDLTISPVATKKSTDHLNGWSHANKQKRKRVPGNKSQAWYDGYFERWKQRQEK